MQGKGLTHCTTIPALRASISKSWLSLSGDWQRRGLIQVFPFPVNFYHFDFVDWLPGLNASPNAVSPFHLDTSSSLLTAGIVQYPILSHSFIQTLFFNGKPTDLTWCYNHTAMRHSFLKGGSQGGSSMDYAHTWHEGGWSSISDPTWYPEYH